MKSMEEKGSWRVRLAARPRMCLYSREGGWVRRKKSKLDCLENLFKCLLLDLVPRSPLSTLKVNAAIKGIQMALIHNLRLVLS